MNTALYAALAVAVHLLAACSPALYTEKTFDPYPEAMSNLQNSITRNGYQVSRVQRVDYGLEQHGFAAEKYRVVFYGKRDEIDALSRDHPRLTPFLPLKITIYETGGHVAFLAINPNRLAKLYTDPALKPTFARWERDLARILSEASEQ